MLSCNSVQIENSYVMITYSKKDEREYEAAKNSAAGSLSLRPHSRKELEGKLKDKGYSSHAIGRALDRLKELVALTPSACTCHFATQTHTQDCSACYGCKAAPALAMMSSAEQVTFYCRHCKAMQITLKCIPDPSGGNLAGLLHVFSKYVSSHNPADCCSSKF